MAQVYFTTLQQLKDNTLIDDNVGDKTLKVIQRTSEDVYLQEILGTDLIIGLKTAIRNNSVTAKQRTLIEDKIHPYLYALTEYLVVEDLLTKYGENGVYVPNANNTAQRAYNELEITKKHKTKAVNAYAGYIREYLDKYISDFPQYDTNEEGIPATKVTNFGFFLDDNDFEEDEQYNDRRGNNRYEETI